MRPASILAGLFFVALTLRPQIVGIGPLLPAIQDDLHTTHAVVGLLGTIPVLCMGLFAPPGCISRGEGRARASRSCGRCCSSASSGSVAPWCRVRRSSSSSRGRSARAWVSPARSCQSRSRSTSPTRPAGPTGVYTTGIQVGSAVSAAIAVPLAAWYGGWRASLAVFSLLTLALTVVWLVLTRRDPTHERRLEGRPPRLPWRSRRRLATRRTLRADGVDLLRHQRLVARLVRRA